MVRLLAAAVQVSARSHRRISQDHLVFVFAMRIRLLVVAETEVHMLIAEKVLQEEEVPLRRWLEQGRGRSCMRVRLD